MKEKNIPLVEDYIENNADKDDAILTEPSKHTLAIQFDKLCSNENLEEINVFIIKPKQAYYSNTHLYVPYINYFIKYFDDDNELIMAYLRLKFLIDRGNKNKYSKEVFLEDLIGNFLTPTMVAKIKKMTEYNYNLNLSPKNKFKFAATKFTDQHGHILLNVGMAIKILIPIVTHYIHTVGVNKKSTDEFLGRTFYKTIKFFEDDNNLYNKIYEFIYKKINKTKNSDIGHWNRVAIKGIDIEETTETILLKLLVDIFYKFNYKGNIIAMITEAIKRNLYWETRSPDQRNLRQLSDVKDLDDGLSLIDKVEMSMSVFDEGLIPLTETNIKQTIKKLSKKYDVEFTKDELDYYLENIKIADIQKDLVFSLFGKYFGSVRDLNSIGKKDYVKLIIIMKKMLNLHGFRILQHVLTGHMQIGHARRMPKKQLVQIINSNMYYNIQFKYKSTFNLISNDNAFINKINTLINADVKLVDYENNDKTLRKINIKDNVNLLIDEFLKFIDLV